jgi:hypothetical protein
MNRLGSWKAAWLWTLCTLVLVVGTVFCRVLAMQRESKRQAEAFALEVQRSISEGEKALSAEAGRRDDRSQLPVQDRSRLGDFPPWYGKPLQPLRSGSPNEGEELVP